MGGLSDWSGLRLTRALRCKGTLGTLVLGVFRGHVPDGGQFGISCWGGHMLVGALCPQPSRATSRATHLHKMRLLSHSPLHIAATPKQPMHLLFAGGGVGVLGP